MTRSALLLSVQDLTIRFPVRRGFMGRPSGWIHAVEGVSLKIGAGETLALVGESGCGKSTTGYAVTGMIPTTGGTILFDGRPVRAAGGTVPPEVRRRIQLVFQDPFSSLNPRLAVGRSIEEPLRLFTDADRASRGRKVGELLEQVGLQRAHAQRMPSEFSGGQRQRIAIARALAAGPALIVLDEPVSALDVSVRSQILNLLMDLQRALGVAYLFISHDLSVVRHVSDRVAVMYLGHIVETGPVDAVFGQPAHPYTQALLSAIPLPDPVLQRSRRRILLTGDLPSPAAPPSGCPFVTRCALASDHCRAARPSLMPVPGDRVGHSAACWVQAPGVAAPDPAVVSG